MTEVSLTLYTFMQVNGDNSKLKRNKTAFKVQVLAPTDKTSPSPSPPPTAHSSGLQVPSDASSTRSPFTNTFRSRYLTMISPRSSNYERLEGGMGPSRMSSHFRWFGWKKFGIVAFGIVALIYLFGPRQHRWSSQEKHTSK